MLPEGWLRVREHKVNQMVPTVKQEILGEGEDVLEETFASASLLANLLIGSIDQM